MSIFNTNMWKSYFHSGWYLTDWLCANDHLDSPPKVVLPTSSLGRSLVPSLTPASLALSNFISFHNYFENIHILIFFSFKHWTEFQGDLHLDKVSFHGLHCRLTTDGYFGWIWESKANPYKNLMARRAGFSIVSERKWEWEFATF